ncbi:hypothetical protein CVT25_014996 [Psilocybe cyanescens]|uniref:Uncharacterized protein n=1 Tax=Psilocybe cyanescens TaxID=93625 RepID=A0A409XIA5_PSICY|nr:hypothetical protein CVT25_014996 [Psilocybe cyanescens]
MYDHHHCVSRSIVAELLHKAIEDAVVVLHALVSLRLIRFPRFKFASFENLFRGNLSGTYLFDVVSASGFSSSEAFAAYIHSLRSSFPAGQSHNSGEDGNGNEMQWKEHASKLEKECEALKQTLEAMEIQTFLTNNKAKDAREATPQTTQTPSSAPTNKKKGKKKQLAVPTPEETLRSHDLSLDLKTVLENLESGESLASFREFPLASLWSIFGEGEANRKSTNGARLFEILDTFFALSALHGLLDFPEKAFISATRRAIDAVSISLDCTIKKDMSNERIQTLDTLLRSVIEKSLPLIAVASQASYQTMASVSGSADCINPLAAFLNQLSTTILVPILHSFFLLSERVLAHLLPAKESDGSRSKTSADTKRTAQGSSNHVDGRPALLAFFHSALGVATTTLSSLAQAQFASTAGSKQAASASTKTREKARTRIDLAKNNLVELSLMHHSLMLEAIRLLDRMFFEDMPKTKADSQKSDAHTSRSSRVLRLVIKDTVWYLCSIIHAVINAEIDVARLLESDDFGARFTENSLSDSSGDLAISRLGVLKKMVLDNFMGLVTLQDKASTGGLEMTSDMHSATEHRDVFGGGSGECIDNKLHGAPLDKDQIQGGAPGTGNMQDFGSRISSSGYLGNDRAFGRQRNGVGNAAGSGTDTSPVARTHVLLDDMERRMILRVVETNASQCHVKLQEAILGLEASLRRRGGNEICFLAGVTLDVIGYNLRKAKTIARRLHISKEKRG